MAPTASTKGTSDSSAHSRKSSISTACVRKISSKRPLELPRELNRFLLRDEDLWERSLRDFGSAKTDTSKTGSP